MDIKKLDLQAQIESLDSQVDEKLGKEFLAEIQANPHKIKELLEELIAISYRYEQDVKKDTKALYEWLIEPLPQAIWVFNSDGSFFYRNTFAHQINEILQNIESKLDSQKSLDSMPQDSLEVAHNGRIYLIQINSFQERRLIVATDITTQKRQERLDSMGQISAHLAHEIRNPIGSMSLLLSTLAKSATTEQKDIIDELQKSIFRVERIIKATLLFSKGIQPNKQPTSILDLKNEILDSIKSYSYTKAIDFKFDFVDKMCLIDKDLMQIALQNFVFNAIDAIEEGEKENGEVSLSAQILDDSIVFKIKDNGKDFDDPNLLFEPFATTKLKGNGLGLALSLEIIKAHQGDITLDAPNKEFSIFIKRF